MKYCFACNCITAGEPLFCNFCGKSYDLKLCPRLHHNPRNAEACSQCGSRDLSTPQPNVPFWVPIVEFLLSFLPGIALTFLSLWTLIFVVRQLVSSPALLCAAVLLALAFGALWWAWSQLPKWFRAGIYRMLKRRREDESRGDKR